MTNLFGTRRFLLVSFFLSLAFSLDVTAQRGGGAPASGRGMPSAPSNQQNQSNSNQEKKTKQDETPLVLKSRVQRVLVPVVVTDKKNQFVPGLTKDDFVIYENGKEQPVLSVDELRSDSARVERMKTVQVTPISPDPYGHTGPVTAYTNEFKGTQTQKRVLIVLIDRINTKFLDQTQATNAVLKFLAKEATNDSLIELLNMNSRGIQVIYDFTTDPKVLIAALQKKTGERGTMESVDYNAIDTAPSADQIQTAQDQLDAMTASAEQQYANFQQQNSVDMTMDCFSHIADAFRGIPGRKSLVWITGSFGMQMTDPNSPFPQMVDRTLFESALSKLSDSNISIYPVDVRGLVPLGLPDASVSGKGMTDPRRSVAYMNSQMNRHLDSIGTLNELAEMTGGKAYYNNNDIEGLIVKAQQDGQNYYLLSYALDKNDTKPGWRKLKVKSLRDGVNVRSRSGFYVTKTTTDPLETRVQDVRDALDSPIDYTAFPVRVAIGATTDAGNGKRTVAYRVLIPANTITIDEDDGNHVSLEVAYNVTDHQGNIVDRNGATNNMKLKPNGVKMLSERGMLYDNIFNVPPGEYSVRFVIRDNLSGRTGSVSVPIKIE